MMSLVIGGARSGKSRYAARVARTLSPAPVIVATSRILDADHGARIARHRADRAPEWVTVEEPRAIARADLAGRVVVVDCVTLWLTNLFIDANQDPCATLDAANAEMARMAAIEATWILVSNELGMAPHAATDSGRKFVDLQGFVNQDIATRSKAVTLMVAGVALAVKGGDMHAALCGSRL